MSLLDKTALLSSSSLLNKAGSLSLLNKLAYHICILNIGSQWWFNSSPYLCQYFWGSDTWREARDIAKSAERVGYCANYRWSENTHTLQVQQTNKQYPPLFILFMSISISVTNYIIVIIIITIVGRRTTYSPLQCR